MSLRSKRGREGSFIGDNSDRSNGDGDGGGDKRTCRLDFGNVPLLFLTISDVAVVVVVVLFFFIFGLSKIGGNENNDEGGGSGGFTFLLDGLRWPLPLPPLVSSGIAIVAASAVCSKDDSPEQSKAKDIKLKTLQSNSHTKQFQSA